MKKQAIRNMYQEYGVDDFYKKFGNKYHNPHAEIIKHLLKNIDFGNSVLDLCCGSGEVTKCLPDNIDVIGCDPYTYQIYEDETGKTALRFTFKDIAKGRLNGLHVDTIICSFALHLCEQSMLDQVLYQLTQVSNKLIILTPHKRPEIKNYWELESEIIYEKVRLRIYSSKIDI